MQTAMKHPNPVGRVSTRHIDQNSHIDTGADAFCQCKEWLKDNGFTLTLVEIGEHAQPLIRIQTGGKCNLLKERHNAVCYGFRGDQGGRVNTWRADVLGCRVEWIERGH